jgi:hypothetical protein
MLVTGGPPVRGGGGMPQRIVTISVPASALRMTGAGWSGKTPGDVAVDDPGQRDECSLVSGDAVKVMPTSA